MWNTGKVGDITVYFQRKDGIRYEIHSSDKLELIVRNRDCCTTHYFKFEGDAAKNYYNKLYDDAFVEEMVNSMPELDQLPKDITAKLQAVKKSNIVKPAAPPTEQA